MKLHIVDRAKNLLVTEGLGGFTFEKVAASARCAKGLITYHHRTRNSLLGEVATQLRQDRLARRLRALSNSGSPAIDALWGILEQEHSSGESAAWFSLLSQRDEEIALGRTTTAAELTALGSKLTQALSLELEAVAVGATTVAALDGFAAALLQGVPADQVRDGYHRFWLGLLG